MKKIIITTIALVALVGGFGSAIATTDPKTIVIAASEVPHSDILNLIKPDIEKEGYKLDIKYISDYATPNVILENGDVDANFFQHAPYLKEFSKARGYKDLKSIAEVHVEPIAAYSYDYKSKTDIKKGAKVGIPNDPTNEGRSYKLLAAQGLIKLKSRSDDLYTVKDVADNPHKLEFVTIDAQAIPAQLKSKNVDFGIINGNIAQENKLIEYRIFAESGINNPYANIIVVRENTDPAKIKVLLKYIHSKKVHDYITTKYKNGTVIPAFNK